MRHLGSHGSQLHECGVKVRSYFMSLQVSCVVYCEGGELVRCTGLGTYEGRAARSVERER